MNSPFSKQVVYGLPRIQLVRVWQKAINTHFCCSQITYVHAKSTLPHHILLATYMSPLLNPLQHCTSLSFSAILPASLHTVGNGSVRLRVLFSLACSGRKGSLWCPWLSSFVIKLVSMSHGLSVVFSFLLFLAVVEERRFSCSWDLGLKKFSSK